MERYALEWSREAPPQERSADWYWIVGIMAVALIVVAFLMNNILLATIIGLSAVVMMLLAHMGPEDTQCQLTHRDLAINDTVYPLRDLEAYHIDEKDGELVLRFKTGHFFVPLVVVHVPEEYADEIDEVLASVVPKEHFEEGVSHRVLEIFGF